MRVLTDAENAVREAGQTNGYITIPLTTNQSVGIKDLSADPATLDFNAVAVGDSMEKTLTLTSTGTETVTIDQLNLLGIGDGNFSVTSVEQNSLAPNESTTVTVIFTRPEEPAPSTYIDELTITSDSSAGPVIVNLVANP